MDFPDGCPICGGHNGGRGTCAPCSKTVNTFRNLIRNLQRWRSLYEADASADVLCGPDGREWLLWDIERFYEYRRVLPEQQRRCIELFLYENHFERETAEKMGVGKGSQHTSVAIYATVGLIKLLSLARDGELPGCSFDFDVDIELLDAPVPIPLPRTPMVVEVVDPAPVPLVSVQVTYRIGGAPVVVEYPSIRERLLHD